MIAFFVCASSPTVVSASKTDFGFQVATYFEVQVASVTTDVDVRVAASTTNVESQCYTDMAWTFDKKIFDLTERLFLEAATEDRLNLNYILNMN